MSVFDNLSARMDSAFAPIQGQLEPLLDSLSPRDRKLLLGLLSFFGLLLIVGAGWWMTSSLSDMRGDIDDRKDTLAFVRQELADYHASQSQLEAIEAELEKHAGNDFSAFMEKAATTAGMNDRLESVRPTATTTIGTLEVKSYDVNITRVSLDQLLDFLYAIETDGYPLHITNATIKGTKSAGVKVLNTKLEVSAYRLIKEDG